MIDLHMHTTSSDGSDEPKCRIIRGCEFSVVHNRKHIKILGYGIDLDVIDSKGIVSDEKFLERENAFLKEMMKTVHFSSNRLTIIQLCRKPLLL